jgi:hypothetical protein
MCMMITSLHILTQRHVMETAEEIFAVVPFPVERNLANVAVDGDSGHGKLTFA